MVQKTKGFIKRNLTTISFFIALSGFLNEIVFYIKPLEALQAEKWFYYLRAFSEATDFCFIKGHFLSFNINPHSQLRSSYFSLVFFAVFLLGVLLYKKSKSTETRLLRFSLSVVLMSTIASILYSLFILFLFRSVVEFDYVLLMISQMIFYFLILVIGFYGLKILIEERMLQKHIPLNQDSVQTNTGCVYAALYHRMFHLPVDTLIAILVFSNLALILENNLSGEWFHFFSEDFVVYFLMSILLFGYYVFFEMVFKATPAKFLTETQVVSTNGEALRFKNIVIRTLSRRIPFDGFSFALTTGWHDKFSKTVVVKEQNIGIPSRKYLWIFPGLLLGGILLYGLVQYQIEHAEYSDRKEVYEKKLDAIDKTLEKGLTTSHYIQLTSSDYQENDGVFSSDSKYYDDWFDAVYLKVEEVTPDTVTVSKIECNDSTYFYCFSQVNDYYRQSGVKFKKLRLSKDKINAMIHRDFDVYDEMGPYGINLFNNGKKYFVENIVNFKEPIFELNVGGSFSFEFINRGDTFYLVAIEDIKAPVKFDIKKPIRVNRMIEVSDKTSVEAISEDYQHDADGSFTLVLKMDLNSDTVFRYSVEKISGKVDINRIY